MNQARPLLLERAFHILLDKDDQDEAEDLDMHEMFRVMCTAFQCAMTRPENRPNMSEVNYYILKFSSTKRCKSKKKKKRERYSDRN